MALDPQVRMLKLMKDIRPAMRYMEGQDFGVWQGKARAGLAELLGGPYEAAEPDIRVEWTRDDDPLFTETRFLFTSEPDVDVVCHLLLPKAARGAKLPLIVCLQGHSTGMHISLGRPKYPGDEVTISGGDRDFALQIVKRGQAALAVEQRAFGERGGTPKGPACVQPAVQALMLGQTLIGQRCWDISRAIDAAAMVCPSLDMTRVGIMGNSGGGTATIYAAALDTRISAAMPSCAFSGFLASIGAQAHCLCNYVPDIMKYFDMGDLCALIAPRPLVIVSGKDDSIFPLDAAKAQADITRRAYAAAGAQDKFEHVIGPEGHRFYADLGWEAFDRVTGWRGEV